MALVRCILGKFALWLINFEERLLNKLISVGACGQAAKLDPPPDTQADRNWPAKLAIENNDPVLPYHFLKFSVEHFPVAYNIQILSSIVVSRDVMILTAAGNLHNLGGYVIRLLNKDAFSDSA